MAVAAIPGSSVAKVQGFHRAVVIVAAVDFGVAIVEAATGIEVLAIHDPVFSLRLVVDCGAFRIVMAQAHARLDEDAVYLVSHDCDRHHVSEGKVVEPAQGRTAESATGCLREIVVLGRLVVDRGDPAVCVGAEPVLRDRVGVSACVRNGRGNRLDNTNIQGLTVRLPQNLIERAAIGGI